VSLPTGAPVAQVTDAFEDLSQVAASGRILIEPGYGA